MITNKLVQEFFWLALDSEQDVEVSNRFQICCDAQSPLILGSDRFRKDILSHPCLECKSCCLCDEKLPYECATGYAGWKSCSSFAKGAKTKVEKSFS